MRFHGGDLISYEAQFHKIPIDFSVNVSPLGLPEGVRQAVIRALDDAGAYPDVSCRELRQALAGYHGISHKWILCGNGAADLIDRLAFALAGSGSRGGAQQKPSKSRGGSMSVLLTAPTFTEYRFALERAGLSCISYPLSSENGFAIQEDFLDHITSDLTAVFLCEPNNPTGRTTDRELLVQILKKCSACGVRLIIDECFQDFLDEPDAHTMQDFLDEPDAHTFLLLKSFTKTYAMAGIRLGYCISADTEFLQKMEQAAQPWAVSGLAQAAGVAALQEDEYREQMRTENRIERERMRIALEQAGCSEVQGEANYLFFWHARTDLAQCLAEQGILIRTCTDYEGLDEHWYRVAVRTREENNRLLAVMGTVRPEEEL